MKIKLKKFGELLNSRELGKEAFLAIRSEIEPTPKEEEIRIDFEGVRVLAPSWADEFFSLIKENFQNEIVFEEIENSSIQYVLDFLEDINSSA